MPCICYVKKQFRPDTLAIIQKANQVIGEYQRQGFKLTLRQLYYQFVAKDLLPDSWIDREYNTKYGPAGGHEEHDEELQAPRRHHQRRPAGGADRLGRHRGPHAELADAIRPGPVRTPLSGPAPTSTPWTCGPSKRTTSKCGSKRKPWSV